MLASAGKVLALYAQGPESSVPELTLEKLGVVAHTCNPWHGEAERGDCLGLTIQPAWINW